MGRGTEGRGREHDTDNGGITLSTEEMDKLTADVMRYMIFKAHKQPNVPVKREELTQLITDTYRQRNLPGLVISKAQAQLKAIFGFEMVEIQRTRQPKSSQGRCAAQGTTTEVKVYVLKSLVSEKLRKKFIETTETVVFSGFALVVVGILQLIGDKVAEDTLWQQLKRLDIHEADEHPVFGNIKQAMETLVKQRYIQREKVSGNEGDTFVFDVAERALDERFKDQLQAFISKLVKSDAAGSTTP